MTALDPRPRSIDAEASVLVDAAMDGDELAWCLLRDRFAGQVRAVAAARVRDPHAVEDIIQDTFLRAWTRIHQLDDPDRLGPWLKTIAARVAIDHIRAQRPMLSLDAHIERPLTLAPLEDHVVEREDAAALHGHLADLREADRVALWQRDALGASVADVADQLGMTAGSVRVLLTRARGKVRQGYGVLALPLLGLVGRTRSRWAGLGEAMPIAVIAPALVVAAVVGVTVPDSEPVAPPTMQAAIAPAPAPSVAAMPLMPIERTTATTPATTTDTPSSQAVLAQPAPTSSPSASTERGSSRPDAAVTTPGGGAVIVGGDQPVADGDPDAAAEPNSPTGGIESLEVYLDEAETGEGETTCLVGTDCG